MINSHAKELRDKLMKDACDTGQSYDILDDVTHSTLDIICGKFKVKFISKLNLKLTIY